MSDPGAGLARSGFMLGSVGRCGVSCARGTAMYWYGLLQPGQVFWKVDAAASPPAITVVTPGYTRTAPVTGGTVAVS